MALYTIRSERQLMEQINYNLLFRWFVGFSMDDEAWNHSIFTKNRDRLLGGEVAQPDLCGAQPGADAQSRGGVVLNAGVSRGWSAWYPVFPMHWPSKTHSARDKAVRFPSVTAATVKALPFSTAC
jgi:hypothetical protein